MRVFIVLLLGWASVKAAPAAKDKKPYYFPTTVGDTLEYEFRIGESLHSVFTERVDRVEERDGVFLVTLVRQVESQSWSWRYEVSEQRLTRTALNEKLDTRTVLLLLLPAKKGDVWELQGARANPPLKSTDQGEEEITVPLGKFKARRVATITQFSPDEHATTTNWFAPHIGLVKSEYVAGDLPPRIQLLKALKPGKK